MTNRDITPNYILDIQIGKISKSDGIISLIENHTKQRNEISEKNEHIEIMEDMTRRFGDYINKLSDDIDEILESTEDVSKKEIQEELTKLGDRIYSFMRQGRNEY